MKKILLIATSILTSIQVFGQASLPTSWDFSNTPNPPTGWSYDLGPGSRTVYTVGTFVKTNPALRLDFTTEYMQVNFADEPGNFVYHIAGTGGIPWQGNVQVQESVDGNSFSTIRTYNPGDINGSTRLDSVTLSRTSRFVRIYFANKTSGYNLAIDDAVVRKAPPSPEAEIDITYQSKDIISGQTIESGNTSTINLDIKNSGTSEKLYISDVRITGTDASQFSPSFTVDSINANSTKTLAVAFNPSGMQGDRNAKVTIISNDDNERTYEIDIYAINGNVATEPITAGYSLSASSNTTWRKEISLTAGSNPTKGWLLIQSQGNLNQKPMDQNSYEKGQSLGNGKIIAMGTESSFIAQEVIANTAYNYNLFLFNGYGNFTNYSDNPVSLNTPAVAPDPGTYYTGIDVSDSDFINKLTAKINPHFQVFYSNYASTILKDFYERDTTNGQKVITGQYSGHLYIYNPPFAFDTMSREHTYPYSWMAETDQDKPNYSDLHNLHPVHQNRANGIRSNYPLGNVDELLFTFKDAKFGRDTGGNLVYEPRDAMKGAAARSKFYMLTCYNGSDGRTWWLNPAQSEEVLKDWHNSYPPNNFEIARNEYIASIQNNRNPFIDNPEMACYINFKNMSYNPNGATDCSGINNVKGIKTNMDLNIYPNPGNNTITLNYKNTSTVTLFIYDINGKLVLEQNEIENGSTINTTSLEKGNYLVYLRGEGITAISKFSKL